MITTEQIILAIKFHKAEFMKDFRLRSGDYGYWNTTGCQMPILITENIFSEINEKRYKAYEGEIIPIPRLDWLEKKLADRRYRVVREFQSKGTYYFEGFSDRLMDVREPIETDNLLTAFMIAFDRMHSR